MWPHYRQAVMAALDARPEISFDFYGSGEPYNGIKHAEPSAVRRFVRAPFRRIRGHKQWQPAALSVALRGGYDAIIYLGDPHFLSTWAGAAAAAIRRTPVLFWAHGWLRDEPPAKSRARNLFFGLADHMLVYAERAKRLGVATGYPADRITVVYNSLDVDRADAIVARIADGTLDSARPQALFADPGRPLLICTARITDLCRFDLLLDAAARLARRGRPVNVLLVGDGPALPALEVQARALGVAVHFYGPCYDEEVLGQLIYHADLTVSPGKIGLTAMHSLMYGTPAITHGNLDEQMPEVEAIEPGRTGVLFAHGDADALAEAIAGWLDAAPDRSAVRAAARAVIHEKWNPQTQAAIIARAVQEVAGG
jgi:glycosyltransferase involved in cell wall biosynthesis